MASSTQKHILVMTAGFAMFSMFFGAGNLVFPILIGMEAFNATMPALLGLFATGIVVPFLGLFAMTLFNGDYEKFFGMLGPVVPYVLITIILCLVGPFGALPRCVLVSHGAITLWAPEVPPFIFNAVYCLLLGLVIWRKNKIVDLLGHWLAPLLLVGVMAIILFGLLQPPIVSPAVGLTRGEAWNFGFSQGYQTLDLLGAFFFSATTLHYLQKRLADAGESNRKALIQLNLKASMIGAGLLFGVYAGFVWLGAKFAFALTGVPPESLISALAQQSLGDYAVPVVSLTILLACFTTAVVIAMLFADFLATELKQYLKPVDTLVITLCLAYVMSLLGFERIMYFLGAILTVLYPALIALTVANIVYKLWERNVVRIAFWGTTVVTLGGYIPGWLEYFGIALF